ncbi:MAG: ATP-binding cassette domain-containing protein [Bacteroidetes bacterium]|jgi:heme ABC exporter ATP-binding subunit CcmA|nr:ATP-binding cassette domain-containing protein [Bacteroidota bacterium]
MTSLTVTDLSKFYSDKPVFEDLSFECMGTIVGIAGPNGSGKTTLLRSLSGLNQPTSGSIAWTIDTKQYTPGQIQPYLGYAAPYIELYEELTAHENLAFIKKLRSSCHCEDLTGLEDRFEITSFAHSLYGKLSSGQQQRVKLASAVVHNPLLLCLDEPGTNLDKRGHQLVESMIHRCIEKDGVVLLATNQSHELEMCNRQIWLGDEKPSAGS